MATRSRQIPNKFNLSPSAGIASLCAPGRGVGGEVEGSTPGEGGGHKFSGAFCASWWMILAAKLPVNDR